MFDIGLNLTSSQFSKDRDEAVARAFAAEVKGLLLTGTNLHESEQAQQLAQRYERCWSTAGVHPHDSSQWTPESGGNPAQAGEDTRSGGDWRMRPRFQP